MSDTRDKRFQPWLPPSRAPAPHELVVRKMLTEALKIVLLFIRKNNLYTFDNEIRLQLKGGPHWFGVNRCLGTTFYGMVGQRVGRQVGENWIEIADIQMLCG